MELARSRRFARIAVVSIGLVPASLAAQPVTGTDTYRKIRADLEQIWIVDTHEHLTSEAEYLKRTPDFLVRMLGYLEYDLESAGSPAQSGVDRTLHQRLRNPDLPVAERWDLFARFWPDARFTGYGRSIRRAVKDLYGFDLDTLTAASYARLNERIAAANTPGLFKRILRDKAHIEVSIDDMSDPTIEPELFAHVMRIDRYVTVTGNKDLDALSAETKVPIHSLKDMTRAAEAAVQAAIKQGIIGFKCALSYQRTLSFPRVTEAEAEAAFNKALATFPYFGRASVVPSDAEMAPYQNYMLHVFCRLAALHKLPFQFHTGLQTGSGNIITNSKPTDLVNLIMEYPDVKFVVFHGAYPYGHELGTMAKNFQNVYIDMCWLPLISPKVARESLSEWLETVPANKIMAFGGDFGSPEGAYGHAETARDVVAAVLAEKVLGGYISESDARELGVKLLRTNALALFTPLSTRQAPGKKQ